MEDATIDDFREIGASPNGFTEKRRAFLILKKSLNNESTEPEWERAQRILYHIKRNVPEDFIKKGLEGFDEFLVTVDENAPSIVDDVRSPIGLEPEDMIPDSTSGNKSSREIEDEELFQQYYEIFPDREGKKGKK